ncbi:MAG: HAMP domain-containing sensor histidine kinase [Streptococcus sp.]|nr:HAMP domain-containing sensor histidine kinase [Streptococcus sp.]
MFNKLKKTWYADDFSYFIRNFGVFTLIFSAMTLIILQVMHSSLYTSVDEKLQALSTSPQAVIQLALNRATEEVKDIQPATADASKAEIKPNVSSNTEVLLFDKDFNQLLLGNRFLGLDKIKLDKKELNHIRQIQVVNSYGQEETYRMILMETNSSTVSSNVKYAAVLINISQLEQISQNHEHLIVVVMASFWLLSLIASVYLARVSVKPLLESMQKQKSFVENASHELRTPLAVLQNRLETLFRKPEATIMESSESIASSLEEVRNMRFLTTNLLNLARRDDGIKPEIAEVSPQFFKTTFANYELIASENDRVFEYENRIYRSFMTDQLLLKQLMTILFDNAIKYTEEDGKIEFVVHATDRHLYLSVTDNGIGISAADKKKIFDRFYRVDKARTRQKGGFGLGLSLAKQIVDALRGTITVKDNKPRGTIFEVKIAIQSPPKRKNK